jgi:hypothetical protein
LFKTKPIIVLLFSTSIISCLSLGKEEKKGQISTANAGKDQTITLPTDSIILSGNVNGKDITYSWTEVSTDYSSGATITSPDSATTVVKGLPQGVWYFQLRVSDSLNHSSTDVMTVYVNYYKAPSNVEATFHPIFSDPAMYSVVNQKDNKYYPVADAFHSQAGREPHRYLLYRDIQPNLYIDAQCGKLYSIIRDGVPAEGGMANHARTEIGNENATIDSNHTYIFEWKGYTLQNFSEFLDSNNSEASIIFELQCSNSMSPLITLGVKNDYLAVVESFTEGNGDYAVPKVPNYGFDYWTKFAPISILYKSTHTIRITLKEGKGHIGQDAFVKVEFDEKEVYFRNNGQVGQTFQKGFSKGARLYDYDNNLVEPSNHTRDRIITLVTEAYNEYKLRVNPYSNVNLKQKRRRNFIFLIIGLISLIIFYGNLSYYFAEQKQI